jgi:hypothetical protein
MNLAFVCEVCGGVARGEFKDRPAEDVNTHDSIEKQSLRERNLILYRDPEVVSEILSGFLWIGNELAAKPSVFLPLGE